MNRCSILGRLVRDPETRYGQSGMAICKFTVAVDRPKQKGQQKAEADFIPCTAFGKTGELVGNHFAKGSRILISDGSIRTGSYQNKKGDTVYTTEVLVNSVEFIDSRSSGGGNNRQTPMDSMGEEVDF